jgi:hypothetical protein
VSNVKDDDIEVAPFASVTRTVIACDCGESVAVPEITPADDKARPPGRAPVAIA